MTIGRPLLVGFLLASAPAGAQTLGTVLAEHGVRPGTGGPQDLDRPITSYAVENATDLFTIAYSQREAANTLLDELRISMLDKTAGSWLHAVLPRVRQASLASPLAWDLGSLVRVSHTSRYLLMDTHRTPSAGTLLVLSRTLQPIAALDGWLAVALAGGIVMYQHSMVHFAPTHAAELWSFDPRSGQNARLYPTRPYQPVRRAYIERVRSIYARVGEDWFRVNDHHMDPELFDSSFRPPYATGKSTTTIAFVATFGGRDRTPSSTPVLDVLVVCDVQATRCAEEEMAAVRLRRKGWTDGQILEEAAGSR